MLLTHQRIPVDLNDSLGVSQKGHLSDSLWKFLFYAEVLLELYKHIKQNQEINANMLSANEKTLLHFVDSVAPFIKMDFSERMESVLAQIKCEQDGSRKEDSFFNTTFPTMKELITKNIPHKAKLVILVDNLDKAWEKDADFKSLSEFLFSLFRAGRIVSLELKQQKDIHPGAGSVSTIIFLRRDIFHHMRQEAREPNKLVYKNMLWDDPKVLLRIIDTRLLAAFTGLSNPDEIWRHFFVSTVKGIPTKDFIVKTVFPRPRDVIHLVKMAIAKAVDRGNTKVEEQDFLSALLDYDLPLKKWTL